MKYYSQFKGNTLGLFPSLFDDLDPANRWVKLARRLPWRYIELEYNARLRNRHRGADNKPARMVVAACIIKRKLRLTAGETVALIQENPYMQYFCGLSDFTSRRIFSPSLLTSLHERISEDEIHLLVERAKRRARARSYYRQRKAAAADRQETPAQQTAE
ncbi:MAG: transposase [Alloprevotella sp.]|nr:transposase [Bacteroidales bacterium]MCI6252131.1 transposase [Bacteroidales bacterium]MDY2605907.1 transposase [Alloprevotella sp.]